MDVPVCSAAATRRQPNCPGAIVRSGDAGRTWQRISLNMIPGSAGIEFATPSVGYASNPPDLFRTTDGGRDWALVHEPPAR